MQGEGMKRSAGTFLLLAALSGCVSMERGPEMPPPGADPTSGCYHGGGTPPMVPGVQGAWGQPVPMIAPYAAAPPGAAAARTMLSHSVPFNMVQVGGSGRAGQGSGVVPAAY